MKRKYQNEKYISKLHQKQDNFNAKWSVLNNALQNIWTNFWQPSLQKKNKNNKKHSTNMQNKRMLIKIKSYIYSCIPLKHWHMMSDSLRYTWMVKSCWIEQNTKKSLCQYSLCITCIILAASWESQLFAYAKTKTQISFAVTAKLICAFVFPTRMVQSLCFLNPKFQASSHHLWLFSPVCVGPGRKPRRPVFSQRDSYVTGT